VHSRDFSIFNPLIYAKQERFTGQGLFTIIIPSWNNLAYLELCIRSIRQNSRHRHQIIVHVNDGSDGTLEWLQQQTDIDYTHTPQNAGICYAFNLARSLVKTEYIAYFNDDMYALPGWDEALWQQIQKLEHHLFFLSASMIEPVNSGNPCVMTGDFGTSPETFREQDLLNQFASFTHQDWNGAMWPPNVLHRDTYDLVGGYSIEFTPGMYSDPDLCMKLWQIGVREFRGVADSRVYHFMSKSTKKVKRNDGRTTFLNKWGQSASFFTREVLKLGTPYTGTLSDVAVPGSQKWKDIYKKLGNAFKAPW
jgi:glycosyltransferase involved in cell wall biosynthesis